DWNQPAGRIHDLLRAVQPFEPLLTRLGGWTIRMHGAQLRAPDDAPVRAARPGQILARGRGRLLVQTGSGCLEITSYEIGPLHGWINRIFQTLVPSIGSSFDLVSQSLCGTGSPSSKE
ncbi:MAG: hypothetical protein ACREDY_16600, partial [Bradyrhizobium sp.]